MTATAEPLFMDSVVRGVGVDIAVRDHGGEGSPVLLVHGAARNLADWYAMAPLLAAHHRVVAVDLRGQGASGDAPWSHDAAVDDLHAVVTALGLEDVTIVGHSLGGMLAAIYGSRFPLRAAVNLDGHGSKPYDLYDGYDPAFVEQTMRTAHQLTMQSQGAAEGSTPTYTDEELGALTDTVVTAMKEQFDAPPAAARELLERSLVRLPDGRTAKRPSPQLVEQLLAEVGTRGLYADYLACRAPLLVYNATQRDPQAAAIPIEGFADMTAAFRRGLDRRLTELAETHEHISYQQVDATHALVFEVPELLAAQIEEFLAGV